MNGLIDRMMRAAKLEPALYDEVEADTRATSQALLVVVLASIASGIGIGLGGLVTGGGTGGFIFGLIFGPILAIIGWFIWALLTYWIGVSVLKGTATLGELLRTMGFARSPGVLDILRFIPVLGVIIGVVVGIWTLMAGVIAVRQALDFTLSRALLTVIVGWFVMLFVTIVLTGVLLSGSLLLLPR